MPLGWRSRTSSSQPKKPRQNTSKWVGMVDRAGKRLLGEIPEMPLGRLSTLFFVFFVALVFHSRRATHTASPTGGSLLGDAFFAGVLRIPRLDLYLRRFGVGTCLIRLATSPIPDREDWSEPRHRLEENPRGLRPVVTEKRGAGWTGRPPS